MVDFKLSDKQKELRAKAREFALEEILPVVNYFDEQDQFPHYLIEKSWEKGLNNLQIPKKYGGLDYGLLDSAVIVEEISAAGPGMATSIFGNSLGQEPLIMSGNEQAMEKYLTELVKTPKIISFATSEPMMGSDVAGMRCKAEKDGEDYILNGRKYWITNAGYADYCTVFATTDPKARHKGICAFLVEMDWDGVSVGEHIPKLGQRCSNTVGIKFDNTRVPAENVLAPEGGAGFLLAMKTFGRTRPIIGSFAVGAARSALDFAIHYAKKRRAFGQKLSEFQSIQFKLAEMYQKVETSRLLTYKAAWEADQGMDPTISASITKFYSTEKAMEVANDALQIFGGYGYTKMMPIEKLLRDIRVFTIYEGTSEVQRIVVSRHVLNGYETVMPSLDDLPQYVAEDPEKAAKEGIDKNQKAYRCRICGHIHYGEEPPGECPICKYPKTAFKEV